MTELHNLHSMIRHSSHDGKWMIGDTCIACLTEILSDADLLQVGIGLASLGLRVTLTCCCLESSSFQIVGYVNYY